MTTIFAMGMVFASAAVVGVVLTSLFLRAGNQRLLHSKGTQQAHARATTHLHRPQR